MVVELEMNCSYCHRNELVNVSSAFASKFKPGFSAVLEKAAMLGWLIGNTRWIRQERSSGQGPVVMCPECNVYLLALGGKSKKELKFEGDGVFAIYTPNA